MSDDLDPKEMRIWLSTRAKRRLHELSGQTGAGPHALIQLAIEHLINLTPEEIKLSLDHLDFQADAARKKAQEDRIK